MKKHTYAFICILGSTTTFLTHSAYALVSDFAAAGANVNTYLFEDGVDDQWNVGNDGTYQASYGYSGTSTEQAFNGNASVDGRNSVGVLKAYSSNQDFLADGGDLSGQSGAIWQDTIYVDNGTVAFDDQISIQIGLNGSISADTSLFNTAEAFIGLGVSEPGFNGIAGSIPVATVLVNASAEDGGWDGNLFPFSDTTAEEAGWDNFESSITRNDAAESFSASFSGTFTAPIDQASYDSANDRWEYDMKLYLYARGDTSEGSVTANAGSSADILGFYDAAGNAIPEENYSLVSGMQVVPEASSFGLLAGLSALVLVATRRRL